MTHEELLLSSVGIKIRRARFTHPRVIMAVRFDGVIRNQTYPAYVETQFRVSLNGKYKTSFFKKPLALNYARKLYAELKNGA
jgi:hypothetical protein